MDMKIADDTLKFLDAMEEIKDFVAYLEPERYSAEDAALLASVFQQLGGLAEKGETMATQSARFHFNVAPMCRTRSGRSVKLS